MKISIALIFPMILFFGFLTPGILFSSPSTLLLNGEFEVYQNQTKSWEKASMIDFSEWKHFRLAPLKDKATQPHSMLQLNSGEWLILHDSSKIKRKTFKKKPVKYDTDGQFQFILNGNAKKPVKRTFGNFQIEISRASLFFKQEKSTQYLFIQDGDIKLLNTQKKETKKTTLKKQPSKTSNLFQSGDLLVFKKNKLSHFSAKNKKSKKNPYQKISILYKKFAIPGYTQAGNYLEVGVADNTKIPIQIERYGQKTRMSQKNSKLFLGDKINLKAGQKTQLKLSNGDLIRLSGKSSFHIEKYPQKKSSGKSYLFSFFGKMRALIQKKDKNSSMKFKAPTAVIGIKGTDFEAIAGEKGSEVSTLEGVVGLSDPEGKGEVDVKSGMTSSVSAGELPSVPVPIPPEKLKALTAGSLLVTAPVKAATPLVKNITILSPKANSLNKEVMLNFTVVPPQAKVVILLDGKKVKGLQSGSKILAADGEHQISISNDASGDARVTTSVKFRLDSSPPALKTTLKSPVLIVNQGIPISFIWTEIVQSVEGKIDKKVYPFQLDQIGNKSTLKTNNVKLKTGIYPLLITAKDSLGNSAQVSLKIHWKRKPEKPPLLKVSGIQTGSLLKELPKLTVSSDRAINKWGISINNNPIQFEATLNKDKKSLFIPAKTFVSLKDEKHVLKISAKDHFQLTQVLNLNFTLDTEAPVITKPQKKLEVSAEKPIIIAFGEAPDKIAVTFNNQPFVFKELKTRDKISLKFTEKQLSSTGKLVISLADKAGNQNSYKMDIVIKKQQVMPVVAKQPEPTPAKETKIKKLVSAKPNLVTDREEQLHQHYQDSIAGKTGTLEDKMNMTDRGALKIYPKQEYFQEVVPDPFIYYKPVPFEPLFKLERSLD